MRLIMNYVIQIKNKFQNVFGGWFDSLSIMRKLTDDQMEWMQFAICDYSPR